MNRSIFVSVLMAAAVLVGGMAQAAPIYPEMVTIGNPGNAADTRFGCGAVPYTYQISKYAVSIAEWAAFYNDPNSNKVGSFNATYNYWNQGTRTVGRQAPAVYISFNQAAQYCNWLTTGDATQGAYMIEAGPGYVLEIMSREEILATGNLYYVIPTEDEWCKAAYIKPDGSGYTHYAHGADTVPPQSTDGSTGWNYYVGGYALPSPNRVWTVGSGTEEQNGTYNMMGNVWEWNEELIFGHNRGLRGGSFGSSEIHLCASYRDDNDHMYESINIGFRVASIPEPGSITLLVCCAVAGLMWRRRRR
jgi:formylglycine-generating enzyme